MKWNDIPLRLKIPGLIVGFAMAVGVGVAVASSITASDRIDTLTQERLGGVAKSRSEALDEYFKEIRQDLILTATNPFTLSRVASLAQQMASAKLRPHSMNCGYRAFGLGQLVTQGGSSQRSHSFLHPSVIKSSSIAVW